MSYVDLHCHLLPGVDDGAPSLDHAVAHARRLAEEGVRDVAVTPHVNSIWALDVRSIPSRVHELAAALASEGLGVRLHAGGELAHERSADLGDEELTLIAQGPPAARWLLIEAPFAGISSDFVAAVDDLRRRGFGALIAHPERAQGLARDGMQRLRPLLASGALLQVNVCSLLGQHGLVVQEQAARLLRAGLAHVVASDGHPGSREHTVGLGFHLALRTGASSVQGWRLTQDNPRFLLRHGIPSGPSDMPTTDAERLVV